MTRSFQLPEFQIDRAARLNPQLETARAHSMAWAREMGLVDPNADVMPWTAAELAANDFGLLCSAKFPDAPVGQLNTITDWYTWMFHLDDYLVEAFIRTGDLAGAKAYLARIPRFLPIELGHDLPTATNPTEHAVADLWSRTAAAMPKGWRSRIRGGIDEILMGHLQELRYATAQHTANPVEYLDMKRKSNGGRVAASLAEFAQDAELPAAVADGPTVRALVEAVTDSALLLNDLFSYEREVTNGAKNANMVLVLKEYLGCDRQQAVAATNEMITARARQFEHIADVEIPEMCTEHNLTAGERATVSGFVDTLRNWLPGWLEWHQRAERYASEGTTAVVEPVVRRLAGPTGFGTGTARRLLAG